MKRKIADEAIQTQEAHPSKKRALLSEHDAKAQFRTDLYRDEVKKQYTTEYERSKPYKHGVICPLLDPKLLTSVCTEIEQNITFTPKETDIYRIHQSGDLANLDGLSNDDLARLPSLVSLRDALYSRPFRDYLSEVTGAGKLSGQKTDMAVNVYTPGCHLLCHDDVIGTRRVSYILYLTDPEKPWKKSWGGGLRLYPTEEKETVDSDGSPKKVLLPSPNFTVTIPPAFNQLAFFAVQPGHSFHDVEEVYARQPGEAEEDDGGRIRMAISGWYHIPQAGEDGYIPGAEEAHAANSSLAQLQGKADELDEPQAKWIELDEPIPGEAEGDATNLDEDSGLTEQDLNFLLKYMNPRYLTPDTVAELSEQFAEDSALQLGMFLNDKFARPLREQITAMDKNAASSAPAPWRTARPPHKHRFLYRPAHPHNPQRRAGQQEQDPLSDLLNTLLPSLAFKKWLALATALVLSDANVLARRFRRGLDYTLAQAHEDEDPQLEISLGLTPTPGWGGDDEEEEAEDGDTVGGAAEDGATNGHHGGADESAQPAAGIDPNDSSSSNSGLGVGGYEVYMAGDDDDEDDEEGEGGENGHDHGVEIPSSHTGAGRRRERADPAIYKSSAEGEEDDGILFTMPACWNTMSIVLRDKGVLKFVKYVSASAKGDRWDISGEWKVVGIEDEDDEDDDEHEEENSGEDGDEDEDDD